MFKKVSTNARQTHSNPTPNSLHYSFQMHFNNILPPAPTLLTWFLLFPLSEYNWISFQMSLISYFPRHSHICYSNSTSDSSHTLNVTSRTAFNLRRINRSLFLSHEIERQVATAIAVHVASWQHNSAVPTFNGYSWRFVGVKEPKIVNLSTMWPIETPGSNGHYRASRLAVIGITEHNVWQ